jgi:hypothetical protein
LRLNAQEVEFSNFKIEKEQKQLVNLLEHDESLNSKILEIGTKINFKNSFTKQIDDGKLKGSLIKYQNDISVVKFVRDGVTLYEHQETGKFLIELLFGKWFEYICFEKLKNLGFFDNIKWGCNIKRKKNHQMIFTLIKMKLILSVMLEFITIYLNVKQVILKLKL